MSRVAGWYHHGDSTFARDRRCDCEPCIEALERTAMRRQSLPAEPLRRFIPLPPAGGRSGWDQMGGIKAVFTSSQQQAAHRAFRTGLISPRTADELAFALGHHPVEIWGWAWYGFEETA